MNSNNLVSQRWDEVYGSGRYLDNSIVDFVDVIKKTLEENPNVSAGTGLYAGCGDGRNYIPLADSGLDLYGIDISPVAIRRLSERVPDLADKLQCVDFIDYDSDKIFDYLLAIQVFQHGTEQNIKKYFSKVGDMLRTGGLLFLRVNSVSTEIYFKHTIHETNTLGGKTILYGDGPKKDLHIHFYSLEELTDLCDGFEFVIQPHETVTTRIKPMTGVWSQWELVLKRK